MHPKAARVARKPVLWNHFGDPRESEERSEKANLGRAEQCSRADTERRAMAALKDLKLKTGVCKRTLKEFHSYESEEEREAAKTQSMRDNNADPYDIKQQVLTIH